MGKRETAARRCSFGGAVVRQEMAGVLKGNQVQCSLRKAVQLGELQYGSGQPLAVRGWVWMVGRCRVENSERELEVQGRKIEPLGFREVRSSGRFVPERSSWWEDAWCRSRGRARGWSCRAKRGSYHDGPDFEGPSNSVGDEPLGGIPDVQRTV